MTTNEKLKLILNFKMENSKMKNRTIVH